MCAGAIVLARVGRVVYGALDSKAGAGGRALGARRAAAQPPPPVTSGVLADEAGVMLSEFFGSSGARPRTSRSDRVAMAGHLNVELKARCADPARVRRVSTMRGPISAESIVSATCTSAWPRAGSSCAAARSSARSCTTGAGHGRREALRGDAGAPRGARAGRARRDRGRARRGLGVATVVEKAREIRFVGNVKFHLDEVPALGAFVEIEAIDLDGSRGEAALRAQCEEWRAPGDRRGRPDGRFVRRPRGRTCLFHPPERPMTTPLDPTSSLPGRAPRGASRRWPRAWSARRSSRSPPRSARRWPRATGAAT